MSDPSSTVWEMKHARFGNRVTCTLLPLDPRRCDVLVTYRDGAMSRPLTFPSATDARTFARILAKELGQQGWLMAIDESSDLSRRVPH